AAAAAGLSASVSVVPFRAAVRPGDVLETTAGLTRAGTRSRVMYFEARVVCRGRPGRGESSAEVLPEPIVAVTATGTVVVSVPESGSAPEAGPAPAPGVP